MRPGILVQHSHERSGESKIVRSDVCGFIGVVPEERWPRGAVVGDFLEMALRSYADLSKSEARHFFDPITRRAVKSFFENGGKDCILFGLCIESEEDLMVDDPFEGCFFALLDRLRAEEDLGLLAMPFLATLPIDYDPRTLQATVRCQPLIELLLAHCEEMTHRFLILDPPRDLHDRALTRWVTKFRAENAAIASYGAIYYPWLNNGDETFPPSGAVAGVYARLEDRHKPFGVRWPPANEPLEGVTHPAFELRWAEAGDLTEFGINPILIQPTRGVVIWGARTLSTNPQWLFINTRRIVSYISEQLKRDASWVVFENQRPELWEIVSRMVRSRLDELYGAGLLTGDEANSGYLVQCDRSLNPPEVVNAGQVNIRVLLQPVSTAERIVVDLRLGGS